MLDVKKNTNLKIINIQVYYEKTKIILQNELYKTAVIKVRYNDGTWCTIFRKIISDTKIKINEYIEEFISLSLNQMKEILCMLNSKTKEIFNLYFLEYLKRNISEDFEDIFGISKEKNILIKIKKHLLKIENNVNEYIESVRIYSIDFGHDICDIIEIKRSESKCFENIFRCEYNKNNYSTRFLANYKMLSHVELGQILSLIEKSDQLQIFQKYINEFVNDKCNYIKRHTKFNYLVDR